MDLLNKLFDFFVDTSRRLSHRAAVIMILATTAIIINDLMGFSYNYKLDHKIQHAQAISDILENPDLPLQTRGELVKLMDESLNRKTIFEKISSQLRLGSLHPNRYTNTSISENENNILHLVSSAGITIVIFGFLLFYTVFGHHHDTFLERTAIGILVLVFGLGAISLQYYIALSMPAKLYGSWTWNYAINSLIQISFYTLAYFFLKSATSESEEDSSEAPFGYKYRLALVRFKRKK